MNHLKYLNRRWLSYSSYVLILLPFLFLNEGKAQESQDSVNQSRKDALRVYTDCLYCDIDYIRNEITFVNYVRDRNEAHLHILVTTQQTGGGGTEYTLTFIGQQEFTSTDDTLTFTTKKTDTEEIIRKELVRRLKLGLVRYVTRTPLAEYISVSYSEPSKPVEVADRWDYWVFNTSINTYLNGEKSRKYNSLYGSISANRTTTNLKIKQSIYASYNQSNFDYGDQTITSISRNKGFNSLVVFSLTDHWSVGGSVSGFSSTYSNTKLSLSGAPALEYNFFPYSESTRRELRCLYKVGYRYIDYEEETIYDKNSEQLSNQSLTISLDMKEPWGSAGVTLEGSNYFHDFNRNRIELYGNISLRLIEGLSLQLYGNVSRVHDQLSLSKRGATQEEVLLQRRELETQYQYYTSIGLSFTFGSIFNNIVNPRFGG